MAKDVITVDGKEVVVCEDTAKAYRFVHWGIITAVICQTILAFLVVTLFWKAASDGKLESPAQNDSSIRR